MSIAQGQEKHNSYPTRNQGRLLIYVYSGCLTFDPGSASSSSPGEEGPVAMWGPCQKTTERVCDEHGSARVISLFLQKNKEMNKDLTNISKKCDALQVFYTLRVYEMLKGILKIKAQFLINSLESDGLIHGITLFSRKLAHFMY